MLSSTNNLFFCLINLPHVFKIKNILNFTLAIFKIYLNFQKKSQFCLLFKIPLMLTCLIPTVDKEIMNSLIKIFLHKSITLLKKCLILNINYLLFLEYKINMIE